MRIVLDTNLVVRAASPRASLARRILLSALGDQHSLILSNSLYFEAYRVLFEDDVRQLHRLTDAEIHEFLDAIVEGSLTVNPVPLGVGPLIPADPRDDHVLLTAIAGKANVLGTNDNHFFSPEVVPLASQYGIQIWRDVDFIPIL